MQYNLDLKLKGARDALAWLTSEAASLKRKVEESSAALQNYRVKAGILGTQEQRQITAAKIMDFNKAYLEAQAQRMTVEAKLRELSQIAKDPAGAQTIFTVADNPLIQKLKGELSELEVEKAKLLKTYKDRHPEILKVDARIQQVSQKLEAEIQNMLRAVQTESKVAKAREETLLNNVNQLRREGQDLNEKEIQASNAAARGRVEPAALRGGAQALQGDRRGRRARDEQCPGGRGGLGAHGPRPAEEGVEPLPERRGGPRARPRGGVRHRLLRHVREDPRRRGALPRASRDRRGSGVRRQAVRLRPARAGQNAPASLIAETDPRSPASEAYRALRTNIQFAGLDQPCRCIVVTSATAGEGKTTSVANFGVVCAQAGSRVCLVDSDLRRPSLHRIFGLDNTRGLTTALLEGSTLADVARPTRVPNLFLVTSGPLPPESRPSWSAASGCASCSTARSPPSTSSCATARR